jgi:hypothetical protein
MPVKVNGSIVFGFPGLGRTKVRNLGTNIRIDLLIKDELPENSHVYLYKINFIMNLRRSVGLVAGSRIFGLHNSPRE